MIYIFKLLTGLSGIDTKTDLCHFIHQTICPTIQNMNKHRIKVTVDTRDFLVEFF